MMKIGLVVGLIIFLFPVYSLSEKVMVFKDLLKPSRIYLDQNYIYITERAKVNVYSLKDYRRINAFGQKGEGPGEFRIPFYILARKNELLINSPGKISFFTKTGKLIREIKAKSSGTNFYPLNGGYVASTFTSGDGMQYYTVHLYDDQLHPGKEIYKEQTPLSDPGKIELFQRSFMHKTYKNRVYITGKDGFILDCYNHSGDHLFTIYRKDFKRHKITAEDRKNADKYFRIRYGDQYDQIKHLITYPDYFPEIRAFYLADDKIYILPYEWNQQGLKFYIYSLDGKFLNDKYIPLQMQYSMQPYPFGILNDQVYQLVENQENEDWELHINKLLIEN